MIVFQWSAVAVEGQSSSALKIIRRWARNGLGEIGWPAGRVFKNSRCCEAITVEYFFDDMTSFERAWESLVQSDKAALLWEELRPLLNEEKLDRQLYSLSYARTPSL